MPQAATAEHRGDGVDRRNAHHERLARERSEREAGMRAFELSLTLSRTGLRGSGAGVACLPRASVQTGTAVS